MHTEEEAKKCWCPRAQVAAAADSGQSGDWWNRHGDHFDTESNNQSNCIASKCMAWRWDSASFSYPPTPDNPGGGPYAEPEEYRGFCGLAGRPA